MNKIIVQSPTRVDLAGGTLDLWPLYNFVGHAKTVNVAIDIFTRAELTPNSHSNLSEIEIDSLDLKKKWKFQDLKSLMNDQDTNLKLFQTIISFFNPRSGFSLITQSDSPVGGGLGGSSSLTISMMKAFGRLTGKSFSTHEMVHIAHNIEAQVLNTPTGTQDYYPAVSGGLNILEYTAESIGQTVCSIEGSDLEQHFLLVYTGKSHHSGINNFEVLTRAIQKDSEVLGALRDLKGISEKTSAVCMQKDYMQLPKLFSAEYDARIKLAKSFSSPEIGKLREVSLQAGAEAVKICGAGGGGCVLVWVSPEQRYKVEDACEKSGFKVLPAKPVPPLVSDL